jgi:hypothetical protein
MKLSSLALKAVLEMAFVTTLILISFPFANCQTVSVFAWGSRPLSQSSLLVSFTSQMEYALLFTHNVLSFVPNV